MQNIFQELINLFRSLFVSWYGVVIIIACFFIAVTQKAWLDLIKRINFSLKKKGVMASTNEILEGQKTIFKKDDLEKIKRFLIEQKLNTYEDFENFINKITQSLIKQDEKIIEKEKLIIELQNYIQELFKLIKFYEFSYLNLYLVYNSKLALWWFYVQNINHSATKQIFIFSFPLPEQIVNPEVEKEAIFNALLSNGLIENVSSDLYRVTLKGEEFLKFIGLIKN
jgi:hypothetical protein